MLVLSRRLGETIIIADDIKVTILKVTGSQVSIGIEAPKRVSIHREEIYSRIHNEGCKLSTATDNQQQQSGKSE